MAEIFQAVKVKVEEAVCGGFAGSEVREKIKGTPRARCRRCTLLAFIPDMSFTCVLFLNLRFEMQMSSGNRERHLEKV